MGKRELSPSSPCYSDVEDDGWPHYRQRRRSPTRPKPRTRRGGCARRPPPSRHPRALDVPEEAQAAGSVIRRRERLRAHPRALSTPRGGSPSRTMIYFAPPPHHLTTCLAVAYRGVTLLHPRRLAAVRGGTGHRPRHRTGRRPGPGRHACRCTACTDRDGQKNGRRSTGSGRGSCRSVDGLADRDPTTTGRRRTTGGGSSHQRTAPLSCSRGQRRSTASWKRERRRRRLIICRAVPRCFSVPLRVSTPK